jgi:hypothetical protein
LSAAIVLATAGCTTVEIRNADLVETRHYGLVLLQVRPQATDASLVITQGVGLTLGVSSLTLGYLAETAVLSSDVNACRAFIVVNDPSQLAALSGLLSENPELQQICLARKGP